MSRARRPQVRLHARYRLALFDLFFGPRRRIGDDSAHSYAFRTAAKCVTRPSILRGAVLGQRVSAGAAARLLARLEGT